MAESSASAPPQEGMQQYCQDAYLWKGPYGGAGEEYDTYRELQEVVQQDLQALSGLPPHVIGDGILCIVRLHLRCEVCTVVGKPWLYKQGSSCAV